ncbi:MAG: D-alanyl-D-alanine carboxypeptidase family protein [Christensenellales bacterium]
MSSVLKRFLILLVCTAMLCACSIGLAESAASGTETETGGEQAAPVLSNAKMALLYEESTDTILFEMEADKRNAPASMTKVMTAVLVLEFDPTLSGTMVVPEEALSPKYCSWMDDNHLIEGEEVKVLELMKYLLIPSGNEAATTLAMYVAGDIPTFIEMMNAKAEELGMTETHYEDPHGLSGDSCISARDMLTLSRYAMQFPAFRNIVHLKGGAIPASEKRDTPLRYSTTNRVMDPGGNPAYQTEFSNDVIGIKTGSTPAAGFNLSACMVKDDLTFYSVVMDCSAMLSGIEFVYGHYTETIELLRYARTFEKQGYAAGECVTEAHLWGSLFGKATALAAAEDAFILAQEGAELAPEIVLENTASEVKQGETVGRVILRDSFGNVREVPLVAMEDAQRDLLPLCLILGGTAIVLAVAVVLVVRARRKRGAAEPAAEE